MNMTIMWMKMWHMLKGTVIDNIETNTPACLDWKELLLEMNRIEYDLYLEEVSGCEITGFQKLKG